MARAALAMLACVLAFCAEALTFSDRFRSPRNPERRLRAATSLVVLHTTEAHARSSLNKLCERGEAHYCVTENGTIYRIVDRDREAFHAGCSMWNGRESCDGYSIGIEVVGHHDKPITAQQIDALRGLLAKLKSMYGLSDVQIVCHSHVAYGNPNRWHRFKHRGRKRCGMLFATPTLRRRLGLSQRPARDPDVIARRLRIGDAELHEVLYGKRDVMAGRLPDPLVAKKRASVVGFVKGLFISEKKDEPPEKKAAAPKKKDKKQKPKAGATPPQSATPGFKKGPLVVVNGAETPPAKPDGKIKTPASAADLDALIASGVYVRDGPVNRRHSVSALAGKRWNKPDTYYLYKGVVTPGNRIDPAKVAPGTLIYYRK